MKFSFLTAGVLAAGLAGCGGSTFVGSSNGPGSTGQYIQIERLARPAIKEAVQNYDDHDSTARANPYSDPTLPSAITTFDTTVAGRSAQTAATLAAVLIPDEISADLSQTGVKAAYLGVETGGFTGSKFGGRKLEDDVVSLDLGAVFGNTLAALKLVADDGKESPCLTTDNVPSSPQAVTGAAFPYLQPPN